MIVRPKGVVVVVLGGHDGLGHGLALGQLGLGEDTEDQVHVGGPGHHGGQSQRQQRLGQCGGHHPPDP
jgi:hypothetical protein